MHDESNSSLKIFPALFDFYKTDFIWFVQDMTFPIL